MVHAPPIAWKRRLNRLGREQQSPNRKESRRKEKGRLPDKLEIQFKGWFETLSSVNIQKGSIANAALSGEVYRAGRYNKSLS